MEMASFCLKIRHVFGFTWLTERSIGAGPPVIIQLSGFKALIRWKYHEIIWINHIAYMGSEYPKGGGDIPGAFAPLGGGDIPRIFVPGGGIAVPF